MKKTTGPGTRVKEKTWVDFVAWKTEGLKVATEKKGRSGEPPSCGARGKRKRGSSPKRFCKGSSEGGGRKRVRLMTHKKKANVYKGSPWKKESAKEAPSGAKKG